VTDPLADAWQLANAHLLRAQAFALVAWRFDGRRNGERA
jgi:hypothetical protein